MRSGPGFGVWRGPGQSQGTQADGGQGLLAQSPASSRSRGGGIVGAEGGRGRGAVMNSWRSWRGSRQGFWAQGDGKPQQWDSQLQSGSRYILKRNDSIFFLKLCIGWKEREKEDLTMTPRSPLKQTEEGMEKTPMLGKVEGRRREQQGMLWLNRITGSMDLNLSKLWERAAGRGAWWAAIYGAAQSQTWVNDRTTAIQPRQSIQEAEKGAGDRGEGVRRLNTNSVGLWFTRMGKTVGEDCLGVKAEWVWSHEDWDASRTSKWKYWEGSWTIVQKRGLEGEDDLCTVCV